MLVPVYDIVNCGPRHRFVANGKLVHNSDSVNLQNLPSRDKAKKSLKNSIVAPPGHVVVNCDSSQIEARVLAWLSGQREVVRQFADGEDVYSTFATKIYNKPISKETPIERFVGKTCIAEGSLVLTERGEIPIENITLEDRVWDGVEWVSHDGVVFQGYKNVITYDGLTATPDHGVFTKQGPIPFGVAASRMESLTRTGVGGEAIRVGGDYFSQHNSPWEEHLRVHEMYEMWHGEMDTERQLVEGHNSWLSALFSNALSSLRNFGSEVRRYYRPLQKFLLPELQFVWRSRDKVSLQVQNGFYFVGICEPASQELQRDRDRPHRQRRALQAGESAFGYARDASAQPSEYCACNVERPQGAFGRILQSLHRLVDVQAGRKIRDEWGANTRKVRVYDILNAGPRRRFTASGKLVFNCVLGLGYGTGAKKLQHTLKTQPPGADLDDEECQRIVTLYRDTNDKIVAFWRECDMALQSMMTGQKKPARLGNGCVKYTTGAIQLPNKLFIRYANLRIDGEKIVYDSRKGPVNIWGGAMTENIVQALARIIVSHQMIKIAEGGYRPVLTVHDSVVCVVKKDEVDKAVEFITRVMSTPPEWAAGLPVACETKYGASYGEC